MFEFLPLVLTLVLADLYPLGIEPVAFSPAATLAGALALPALLFLGARDLLRRAERRRTIHGDLLRWALECHRIGLAMRLALLAGYAVLLFGLHWRFFVEETLRLDGVAFLDRTAAILPALAGLAALWTAFHPMDVKLRGSTWTRGEYLAFRARASLGTILLPILFMSSLIDAVAGWAPVERAIMIAPHVQWMVVGGTVLVMYTFAPLALRAVWGARPMPPGPLRARLEEVQRRAGFRCRDLLVWHSGGGRIANAMVIGLFGPLRYVIFTDALLSQLDEAEAASVFGHEIGHVKHHHLPLYFGFSFALILVLVWLDFVLGPWLSPARLGAWGAQVAGVMVLIAVLGGVGILFGWVSRRFERQADRFGAEVTGDAEGFARALDKIARLNGIPRHTGSWRYFSIERRIHDVLSAAESPAAARRIDASARRVSVGLLAGYALALGGALQVAAAEDFGAARRLRQYGAHELARQAWDHFQEDRLDLARLEIEAALVDGDGRAVYLVLYGEILRRQGETEAARAAFRMARELRPAGLWERQRLQEGLE